MSTRLNSKTITYQQLAKVIDHSLLRPELTRVRTGGATLEDLRLMRETVSEKVQVKAAAGVRTLDSILPVIDVGCTRVGAIATAVILDEFERRETGEESTAEFPEDTTEY